MNEHHFRMIGWAIFIGSIALAVHWCLNEKGLTGWLIRIFEENAGQRLGYTSWLVTAMVLVIPGYILKKYFEALAWNAHVDALPPPDRKDSSRRSKYIKDDVVAPLAPAKPIQISNIPKEQKEFIATCPACGNLFPTQRNLPEIKCPQCGEKVPI